MVALQILKMRIRNAVRGTLCKHLECFDLRGYLQYHTMMAFWECPFSVCRAKIHCDQLRVDEYVAAIRTFLMKLAYRYFTHVVNTEPDCVSEVDLLKDGSYTVVLPADVVPVTVNDDDPFEPEAKLPTDGGLPAGDPQPELSDPVLDNSNGGPVTELPSNGVTPLSDTVGKAKKEDQILRRKLLKVNLLEGVVFRLTSYAVIQILLNRQMSRSPSSVLTVIKASATARCRSVMNSSIRA